MATTHVTEDEAALDFPKLMERVRAGDEVVIDCGTEAVAVLRSAVPKGRSIDETIARMQARDRERGFPLMMDADFAEDLEEIISRRKPADRSHWDD